MSEHTRPDDHDPQETAANRRRDEIVEEVTAADDTGMVSNEAEIARIEMEEGLE